MFDPRIITELFGTLVHSSIMQRLLFASLCILLCRHPVTKLRRPKGRLPHQLPPGPSLPIIGSLHELFRRKPLFRWILTVLKENEAAGIACIRLGSVHVIPVSSPEIAREFLKKQDANFCDRPRTLCTDYSSGHITTAVTPFGDQWKKMRRILSSEITNPARFRWLLEKRTEEADSLIRYVYSLTSCCGSGGVVDVRLVTRHYCTNVIRKMIFSTGGVDSAPDAEDKEYEFALFQVLGLLYSFTIADYLPYLRCLDLDGHEKQVKAAVELVNRCHDPVVEERIRMWRETGEGRCTRESEDLLDVLISLKDSVGRWLLTTEEIKAQCSELVYAAVDNPSNAVEWALAEMLNQPILLQRATEEIDKVVGRNRLVQESDIPHLNYVKACAREAFRLHPIAPFNLPHVALDDAVVAGYHIPAGSHVLLSRLALGRNPRVWPDPLRFDPERHLKEASPSGEVSVELTEHELRFISFSTGRRGCMGVTLGSSMTVMLFARLIQGFEWSPARPGPVDLTEGVNSLFLAKPLQARACPRLPKHLYAAAAAKRAK